MLRSQIEARRVVERLVSAVAVIRKLIIVIFAIIVGKVHFFIIVMLWVVVDVAVQVEVELVLHAVLTLTHFILLRVSEVFFVRVAPQDAAVERIQVRHDLVKLLHKHVALRLAEVGVVVAAELVVANTRWPIWFIIHSTCSIGHTLSASP